MFWPWMEEEPWPEPDREPLGFCRLLGALAVIELLVIVWLIT